MARLGVALLLFLLGIVFADRVRYVGDKVIRIYAKDEEQIKWLHNWIESSTKTLDVWKETNKFTDLHVKAGDFESITEILKNKGFKYSVNINDLEKLIENETRENSRNAYYWGFNYNKFNRYDAIVGEIKKMANTRYNHAVVELIDIGYTSGNIMIHGVKVSTHRGSSKPVVWVDGGIHPREWISPATVMYLAKNLLVDSSLTRSVLAKYDIYIIPVVNVDGYEYTFHGDRMWRKTRTGCRNNRCCGVDPNRNWGVNFGGPGTSTNPCAENYMGTKAFSEPCVKAVADKMQSLKSQFGLVSYWNVHAYSQLLLTPYAYTLAYPADYTEIKRVGDVFAKAVSSVNGRQFEVGPPSRILYPVGGGSMDWTYDILGVKYSYGPELRPGKRYPWNGFIVSTAEIMPSGNEFSAGFFAAVLAMK